MSVSGFHVHHEEDFTQGTRRLSESGGQHNHHHHVGMPSASSPSKNLRPLNPTAIAFEARTPPPQQLMMATLPSMVPSAVPEGGWSISAGTGSEGGGSGIDVNVAPAAQQSMGSGSGQPTTAEREFYMARVLLQQAQRPALVAVLTSLLDDSPHMAPLIRHRVERAMAAVAQSGYGSPQAEAGWVDHAAVSQQQQQPYAHMSPSQGGLVGVSPPHSQRKGSRGGGPGPSLVTMNRGRDEEMELCAVHGNKRPLKHLAFRPATGQYECVHGFHCLESSAPQSLSTTPKKDFPQTTTDSGVLPQPLQYHGLSAAYSGGGGSGPQRSPPEKTDVGQPVGGATSAPADDEVDVQHLHNLLQTVRQLNNS